MAVSSTNTSTLHFFGGAGSVTGANFMLKSKEVSILVDCGLRQGGSFAEEDNYAPFAYTPSSVDVLFVTHVHLDHIGLIPKLVRDGFAGKIISTEATKALAQPLLMDSMELLAYDAEKRGKPALYDEQDITAAFALWEGVPYHTEIALPDGFSAQLLNAGHILGSAMVEIVRDGRKIIFTGDLGNDHSRLVGPTERIADAHYLVMESVYGDKIQKGIEERVERLEDTIESTVTRGGTLLIPAFSTERTQELIFELRDLFMQKKVPSVPVYIDSPLASKITEAFLAHPAYFREDIKKRLEDGEDIFSFPELKFIHSSEESEALHVDGHPKIILAGSGMSVGGRILSHERAYLSDSKNTLLIVGYQAAGSLGRVLIEGEKTVTIHKEKVPVRAQIEENYGYSAHRDRDGLASFAHGSIDTLTQVFVTMGEPKSAMYLAQRLRDYFGMRAEAPEQGSSTQLSL